MEFVQPKYNRGQIDRSGDAIITNPEALEFFNFLVDPKFEKARAIVENWRSSHAYPMQIIRNNLVNRARKYDNHAIVAQRLKRFSSIADKLLREPHMKLSQMQDIGGCRAIVSTAKQVESVVKFHLDAWTKNPHRHELHRFKDYISSPKRSGYRSVHLIYKFKSANSDHMAHNGQRIEIQIRSRMQHVWATAVEIVGAFTN
jgi:ppGpp synthetase/RelA/SpoT-type nucleotidyltranferase